MKDYLYSLIGFIIWGSKAKESVVSSGTIFCPTCAADARYSQIKVSRYFTLYFIPLFPTATLGEYIQCTTCQGKFSNEILKFTREQIQASLQPWICSKCENRNPRSQEVCLACGANRYSEPPPLPPT